MARRKTPKLQVDINASLSRRLREIRQELFGDHGGPELARRLNVPARTWYNYETGVTIPAEVLLTFIDQTEANPVFLLSGEGPKYRRRHSDLGIAEPSPIELIRRGLEKLEQEPGEVMIVAPENLLGKFRWDFAAVALVPMHELVREIIEPSQVEGYIMCHRQWLSNPGATVGVRLTNDAMYPILPEGSIVAIDRSKRDIQLLQGRMVAACLEGLPMIRWLEISGRQLTLRPTHPSREHPPVLIKIDGHTLDLIIGQVVWSCCQFTQ